MSSSDLTPPRARLFTPEYQTDPYPVYDRLRRESPVFELEQAPGLFALARYADVLPALKDPATFSSVVGELELRGQLRTPLMLFSDPPVHTRLRKLVAKAFTPRVVEHQREAIQARCEELVAQMCAEPEADLVAGLAYPLPVMVIATMLGVQDGDLAAFKFWSDKIVENIGAVLLRGDVAAIEGVNQEFSAYFTQRIAELRAAPEDNLLSELVHVETEDGQLGHEDLLMFCRLLLVAGNETTTGLIVSAARVLDAFPELGDRLRERPELTPTFVEEALRFYSPFQMTIRRTLREVEVAGVTIPEHRRVIILLGSANRDPEQFAQADRFLVERDPNPHLAFGFGIHFCIGAHLARLEGQIAVQTLLAAVPGLRILDEEIQGLLRFGGPPSLRVRFEPRA